MDHNVDTRASQTNQAVELDDEIMELTDSDLQKVSGGAMNDGNYVCWWEAGPGVYTRVCMCVEN